MVGAWMSVCVCMNGVVLVMVFFCVCAGLGQDGTTAERGSSNSNSAITPGTPGTSSSGADGSGGGAGVSSESGGGPAATATWPSQRPLPDFLERRLCEQIQKRSLYRLSNRRSDRPYLRAADRLLRPTTSRASQLRPPDARVHAIRRLLERYQIRADSYTASRQQDPSGLGLATPPVFPSTLPLAMRELREETGESTPDHGVCVCVCGALPPSLPP